MRVFLSVIRRRVGCACPVCPVYRDACPVCPTQKSRLRVSCLPRCVSCLPDACPVCPDACPVCPSCLPPSAPMRVLSAPMRVLSARRDGFALSGVPTGLGPGDFPRVFARYARGAAARPCRGRAIVQRQLDLNHASRRRHRIGQPLRLTRRRTPRRSAISRNFLRLAAKKRPSNRSPRSFSI
jgi:hypothetical protein